MNDTIPLTIDELNALGNLDTPTIANALELLDLRPWTAGFTSPEIRCVFADLGPMVGYAATISMSARHPAPGVPRREYWSHVLEQPAPRIVVVQDNDYPNSVGSFWGEVQANIGRGLGALGCVTNGGVRDLAEARALGFRFFAKDILVSHAYNHIESVGEPVTVGGLRVAPGDLLVADQHGVINVPLSAARQLPALAAKVARREAVLIEAARQPGVTVDSLERAMQDMRKVE